jgi:hypothetical protein
LVVGLGVTIAVYLSERGSRSPGLLFRMMTALPFWPLYLPILLSRSNGASGEDKLAGKRTPALCDDMSAAIGQVDAELDAALNSLDGWAEDVLAREKDRIRELREAWITQANRVREIDHLLALPQYFETNLTAKNAEERGENKLSLLCDSPRPLRFLSSGNEHSPVQIRLVQSQAACRQNIERLRGVRQRAYDDLMGSLAWVRELVSMIHLAKFTGAPASRAEELVAQIAAAVEGLSDVTWRDISSVSNTARNSVLE